MTFVANHHGGKTNGKDATLVLCTFVHDLSAYDFAFNLYQSVEGTDNHGFLLPEVQDYVRCVVHTNWVLG